MPFPRRLLIENEELVVELRPHWIALVMPAIATILVLVGWGLAVNAAPEETDWHAGARGLVVWGATAVAFLLLLLYPVRKFIAWVTSYFVVTSDRVIHREGWIAKRSMEIPLEAINDVRFSQGVLERIIGAGDLVISSASEFGRQSFSDIRNPEEVQKTIYEQGELNKERMYRGATSRSGGSPPSAPATSTELERLADLRDKGVLSQAEFEAQKKKILGEG